jgi:hypothetical protein
MTSRTTRRLAAVTTAGLVGLALVAVPTTAQAAKKPKYKVTASASSTSVKTSTTFSISGKVSLAKKARKNGKKFKGTTVKVQRYAGSAWQTVATPKLTKEKRYSATLNIGKTVGTFSYRVLKPKSKGVRAGASAVLRVSAVKWGTVKAWGSGDDGVLGNGTTGVYRATPVDVSGLTEVVEVTGNSNGDSVLARRYDGTVWAWGDNSDGQLGIGVTGGSRNKPVQVKNLTNVKQVAPMATAGAALKKDGTVWTWGSNGDGELGRGTFDNSSNVPIKAKITNVKQLAANYAGMLALKNDGTVWAWGNGSFGDLGQGANLADSALPLKVQGLPKISQIAAVGDTGYAVGPNGTVFSWGYNGNGELGDGSPYDEHVGTPVQVAGLAGITLIGPGAFDTPYARGVGGTVWSWGQGTGGKLGNGDDEDSNVAVQVKNLIGPKAFAGSDGTGYALMPNGTVRTWGDGEYNGIASSTDRFTPVAIPGLSRVTAIGGALYNGYAVIG